jgi:iron complex outermembrane receptor protein
MSLQTKTFRNRLLASVKIAPIAMLGGLALGGFPALPTHAEDAQVEDVKVTARLREEKAQDVPLAVSVVGGKTQEREQLDRLQDLAQKVPNFVPVVNNPRTSAMSIRGISGISGGADGSESAVGMIVDNVFYTHVGFQWADFIDLQSFEVARGPQGTLLGKNTTVGAVVIHTQLPTFAREASFETTYGNYNRAIERLNVSGPIIDDKLAGRVTFLFDKGDGWIHDAITGAGIGDNNRWGVRGQLLFLGDNFTDRLIFDKMRSGEYNNYSGINANSFPLYANGAAATAFSATLASRLHMPLTTLDPYSPELTGLGTLDQRTIGASNEINAPVGANNFTSVAAWREFVLHPRNASTTANEETDIVQTGFDVHVDQYSFENRLASPKDQPIEWTIGTYFLRETVWSGDRELYGPQASAWNLSGANANNPFIMWGVTNHQDGIARTFSAAAFDQTTWHINEQWALTAGLRNTYEIREGSDTGWVQGSFTPTGIAAATSAQGTGFFDTGGQTARTNSLSGLLNPSFRYNENELFYASLGRGEKSGAINTGAIPIISGTTFYGFEPVITKPEVSWDYELGIKTNWQDNKLVLNANLFWNDIYNYQATLENTDYTNPTTGLPLAKAYLGNIPQVRVRGFEFDGRWSPIERLWITFSGAATDARYVSYPQATPSTDWQWPAGSNINGISAPLYVNLSGQRMTSGVTGNSAFSPYSFNVGFNYEHPLGRALANWGYDKPVTVFGYSNLVWKYKTQLSEEFSNYFQQQPSYSLINAGIGLKTDDGRYSFNLWVKNLADTRYIIGQSIGSPSAAGSVSFGEQDPRTFGGTLRVKLY